MMVYQHRGISLVELLISLSIGSLIVLGLSQTYVHTKQAFLQQTELSQLQTETHYALTQLTQELAQSGYLAQTLTRQTIGGSAPPVTPTLRCANTTQWGRMITQPVYGMNDTLKLNSAADYTGCISNADYLRGDLIVTRSMSSYTISDNEARSSSNQTRLYFRSAPEQGLMFQGKDTQSNTLSTDLQSLHEVKASVYYIGSAIGEDVTPCATSTGLPALFRETLNGQGKPQREEIAQGIENLQVQFGLDTDGDGSVNRYANASPTLDWQRIRAIRVWLLTRTLCPEAGYINNETYYLGDQVVTPGDAHRRLLLATTLALRE